MAMMVLMMMVMVMVMETVKTMVSFSTPAPILTRLSQLSTPSPKLNIDDDKTITHEQRCVVAKDDKILTDQEDDCKRRRKGALSG